VLAVVAVEEKFEARSNFGGELFEGDDGDSMLRGEQGGGGEARSELDARDWEGEGGMKRFWRVEVEEVGGMEEEAEPVELLLLEVVP